MFGIKLESNTTRNMAERLEGQWILNRYKVIRHLGKGAYATVYEVEDNQGQTHHEKRKAMKIQYFGDLKEGDVDRQALLAEEKLLRELHHPNIITLYESFSLKRKFYIVTEFCEGLDLDRYLRNISHQNERIDEDLVIEWIKQILQATEYLHLKDIIHRDIKPRNLLVQKKILKLGDFGVARRLEQPDHMANTIVGTSAYMSPEVLSHGSYDNKCDIWSVGCVLYELVALKHAFEGASLLSVILKIVEGRLPDWPLHYSQELCNIFYKMMIPDPKQRSSATELLASSCFTSCHQTPHDHSHQEYSEQCSNVVSKTSEIPSSDVRAEGFPVNFIIRQRESEPEAIYIDCCPKDKVISRQEELSRHGYSAGPMVSKDIFLSDGQHIIVSIKGNFNIELDSGLLKKFPMVFSSLTDRNCQEGFLRAGHGGGSGKNCSGFFIFLTCEKNQSMDGPNKVLCSLPVSFKMSGPIPTHHLVYTQGTGLLSEDIWNPVVAISRSLQGDEWKKLARELHYRTLNIGWFQRHGSGSADSLFSMLMDWFQKNKEIEDKLGRLTSALQAIGHNDVSNEIKNQQTCVRAERNFLLAVDILIDDANLLRDHEQFLRVLGLSDADILAIHFRQSIRNLRGILRDGLILWRNRRGLEEASVTKLIECLNDMKYRRLAERITEYR